MFVSNVKGYTGFPPKKDARFSKLKYIPDPLSDENEGEIMENVFSGRLLWETLYIHTLNMHLHVHIYMFKTLTIYTK